jgi:ferredoxin
MAQRPRVDRIACRAHGVCAELLPELLDLDEWGYPIVTANDIPPELRRRARAAVAACPALALRLENVAPPRGPAGGKLRAGAAHNL